MDNERYKIILVDDNVATLDQGKNMLQAYYKVYTVQSAITLFENLEHMMPDMILLDVEMPDMDGFEAIKKLKADDRYKDIPVVFVTSKSDEENEKKGFSLGAVDYITKPFSGPLLHKRISNHMLYLRVLDAVRNYSTNLETMLDDVTRANNRARALLDMTPISVRLWDTDYNLIDCNIATLKLFGFADKEEAMEKYSLLYPEYQPDGELSTVEIAKYIDIAFREGTHVFKWTYRLLDGTLLPTEVTLIRIEFENSLLVAGYTMDLRESHAVIEEKQRANSAEQISKAKSRFLANISHEIRTPMNSILGFSELALDLPENTASPQVREYLVKIRDNTKWLLHIVNDILDISKIEFGRINIEKVPFNIAEVVSRCQSVILQQTTKKDLEFKVNIERIPDKLLVGDPVRLYQALMNLLANAVKFTEKGTIEFSALAKSKGDYHATIYFEVKDTGIGMTDEQVTMAFEPFMQGDTGTTRNYSGSGLGLAITKNIVELLNGDLSASSTLGEGSVFSFEIEFETLDLDENDLVYSGYTALKKPQFEGYVLVCDDNEMNQEVICEHLARVGLVCVVAENGNIGVQMVKERLKNKEKLFDLVLMDIYMPVMDGIEAAHKISKLAPELPIIAMTANIMAGDLEEYKKHGMPDCLGKPFTAQDLWRILLKYLKPISFDHRVASAGEKSESATSDVGVNKLNFDGSDYEMRKKLEITFVKKNQTKFNDFEDAIDAGNIELAHRLVHSLKGNAGLIGKNGLRLAAEQVEGFIKNEKLPIPEDVIRYLKAEFDAVINELQPFLNETEKKKTGKSQKKLSPKQVNDLLTKLEGMLNDRAVACVNLLDDIRLIPGTEELAGLIEDYEFKRASEVLKEGKDKWI